MFVILLLVVHVLCSVWYACGSWGGSDGWVRNPPMTSPATDSVTMKYLTSARWTLAQILGNTDLEDGRSMVEQVFTILFALFTVVFMSYLVGSLTTKMMDLHRT